MRATRYYIQFLLLINNESQRKWVTIYLYYTVISMGTHTPPPIVDGKLLMAGTLKELNALQWGQMKRANPLPPGLSQINTTVVFIHCTIGQCHFQHCNVQFFLVSAHLPIHLLFIIINVLSDVNKDFQDNTTTRLSFYYYLYYIVNNFINFVKIN